MTRPTQTRGTLSHRPSATGKDISGILSDDKAEKSCARVRELSLPPGRKKLGFLEEKKHTRKQYEPFLLFEEGQKVWTRERNISSTRGRKKISSNG